MTHRVLKNSLMAQNNSVSDRLLVRDVKISVRTLFFLFLIIGLALSWTSRHVCNFLPHRTALRHHLCVFLYVVKPSSIPGVKEMDSIIFV